MGVTRPQLEVHFQDLCAATTVNLHHSYNIPSLSNGFRQLAMVSSLQLGLAEYNHVHLLLLLTEVRCPFGFVAADDCLQIADQHLCSALPPDGVHSWSIVLSC